MITWEFLFRLLIALTCGAAMGLERQLRQRNAGLRTVTLVACGACLFVSLGVMMSMPADGLTHAGNGVTQIASYVVSGVGFLGGGVIMRDKGLIQGINTAATLWCSAAVGVLSGAGYWGPAVAGTGVVLIINTLLRSVGHFINNTAVASADIVNRYVLTVECSEENEIPVRAVLANLMASGPLSFQSLKSRDLSHRPQTVEVTALLATHPKNQPMIERVASRLSLEKGVSSIEWTILATETLPE